MRRLPSLLTEAKDKAEGYRVLPGERGFSVWRFRSWSHKEPGWRCVAAGLRTRAAARHEILERLGLAGDDPPPDMSVHPAAQMADTFFDHGCDGS